MLVVMQLALSRAGKNNINKSGRFFTKQKNLCFLSRLCFCFSLLLCCCSAREQFFFKVLRVVFAMKKNKIYIVNGKTFIVEEIFLSPASNGDDLR
jgi:hypothetical protein